jgi:hypothetical protein
MEQEMKARTWPVYAATADALTGGKPSFYNASSAGQETGYRTINHSRPGGRDSRTLFIIRHI